MAPLIRVFVVDDQPAFRSGLRHLLTGSGAGIRVVGEATPADGLPEQIARTRPQVVLFGLGAKEPPEAAGILERLLAAQRAFAMVVIMAESDAASILRWLRQGALGMVTKEATAAELSQAVHHAARRKRYFSSSCLEALADHLCRVEVEASEADEAPAAVGEALSARECEVLSLIGLGWTNQQIADRLSLSLSTVKTYVSRILDKLGLQNRVQAALYAKQYFPAETKPEERSRGRERED